MNNTLEFCAWCRRVAGQGEAMLVRSEDGRSNLCGTCISHAVITLYGGGVNLPTLENGLRDLFVVSGERERAMKAEVLAELREQYQREFLDLREPWEPQLGEDQKTSISVTVNRYTFERVQALAREACVPISQWMRQAIFLAFKATSHKRS